MKKFFFIFLFLFVVQVLQASPGSLRDTILKERYKLSEKNFLQVYGTDDTSKAMIKYYFDKREAGGVFLVFYGMIFITEVYMVSKGLSTDSGIIFAGTAAYTALIFVPSNALLLGGIHRFDKYSKKNLYADLMSFKSGKGLPEAYKMKIIYKLTNP